MKSYWAISRRWSLVTTAVFLFLIVMLIVFLVVNGYTRTQADEPQRVLAQVNAVVRLVWRSDSISDSEIDGYYSQLRGEVADLAALTHESGDAVAERFLADPVSFLEDQGDDEAIAVLRRTAERANAGYRRQDARRFSVLTFYLFTLAGIMGVMVLLEARARADYRTVSTRAVTLLQNVRAILSYKTQEIDLTPEWHEEELLVEQAEAIARTVRDDRLLTQDGIYGGLDSFIPVLRRKLSDSVPCDRIAVAFIDAEGSVVAESAEVSTVPVRLEPGFREDLSATTLGTIVESRRPRIISDLQEHYRTVHRSRGTELILEEGIRSSMTLPLQIRDRCVGFLFISSTRRNAYTDDHLAIAERMTSLLSQSIYFHYLTQQIVATTANAFVHLMEYKDNETSLHITRMSSYSHAIAKKLAESDPAVTPELLREILWFAPLHDIGKVGIPDAILLKPGSLSREERKVIETHVQIASDVITRMDERLSGVVGFSMLKTAKDIVDGHHECYDGSGYPAGLAGTDIPLAGRIVAVADVFDALTSRRPYKDAMTVEEALNMILEGRGSQFCPQVCDAFLAAQPEILGIYETYRE